MRKNYTNLTVVNRVLQICKVNWEFNSCFLFQHKNICSKFSVSWKGPKWRWYSKVSANIVARMLLFEQKVSKALNSSRSSCPSALVVSYERASPKARALACMLRRTNRSSRQNSLPFEKEKRPSWIHNNLLTSIETCWAASLKESWGNYNMYIKQVTFGFLLRKICAYELDTERENKVILLEVFGGTFRAENPSLNLGLSFTIKHITCHLAWPKKTANNAKSCKVPMRARREVLSSNHIEHITHIFSAS